MWKTMRKHGGSGNSYPFQTKLVDSQGESSKPQFLRDPQVIPAAATRCHTRSSTRRMRRKLRVKSAARIYKGIDEEIKQPSVNGGNMWQFRPP